MRNEVAIVGSHSSTRGFAPYNDPNIDIWVFNEAGNQAWTGGKRIDAVFQMHTQPVYRNPLNRTDKNHWAWLQQEHPFPIYMQALDPLVPACVEYPKKEIIAELQPGFTWTNGEQIEFFTNSISYAIALAIYQGYPTIRLYGIEMESNTEYVGQRDNVTFWTGLALGRGIRVIQGCGEGIYSAPLYGYQDEITLNEADFRKNLERMEQSVKIREQAAEEAKAAANALEDIGGEAFVEAHENLISAVAQLGVSSGVLDETKRYIAKIDIAPLVRQEFEQTAALAARKHEKYKSALNFHSGRCSYIWEAWQSTKIPGALEQFHEHAEKQLDLAFKMGWEEGCRRANGAYLDAVDERIRAAGGEKAIAAKKGE